MKQPDERRSERFRKMLLERCSEKEAELTMLAYRLSKYGHREQWRDGGERYFEHPLRVARFLWNKLQVSDCEVIIAALLHDLIEDSWLLSVSDVCHIFGPRVAKFVDLLSKKPGEGDGYFARILEADVPVRQVKISDRRDNLRTMRVWAQDRQERYIQETRTYMIPIAERTDFALARELDTLCVRAEQRFASKHQEEVKQ